MSRFPHYCLSNQVLEPPSKSLKSNLQFDEPKIKKCEKIKIFLDNHFYLEKNYRITLNYD
ncbi:MAG: hypothetical protein EBT63_01450 [Proteobacteria bacterium]|nr:hypothetical protein [Pseudomonadota bacterium]NCA28237.1 hypothetical protein [Pseudomonadota bacterium]